MPLSAVLLFQDEIILRLFPVLRRAWSLSGQAGRVGISGKNARQVLFGTINVHTAHRVLMRYPALNQTGFQAFLRLLRRRYAGRPIWLLLDAATAHTTARSRQLAQRLGIEFICLPKQCPELNAMDHLWKELRADSSANYQYQDVDEHVVFAELYTLSLSNQQARKRAGILAENFWLKSFLK